MTALNHLLLFGLEGRPVSPPRSTMSFNSSVLIWAWRATPAPNPPAILRVQPGQQIHQRTEKRGP